MNTNKLKAISPIDGRYADKVNELSTYFSEFALIKYRVYVEIEYFKYLCSIPLPQLKNITKDQIESLTKISNSFDEAEAQKVKDLEKVTNHDVKAVEYYLKNAFDETNLAPFKEFIHFGLTSQDINNTAVPLMLKEAMDTVIVPAIEKICATIQVKAETFKDVTMLARTHGQAATPTSLGKEFRVFSERITNQLILLRSLPIQAKFGGATGNLNAHKVTFPDIDWIHHANAFVNGLNLQRQQTTTQIEHYDMMAALFQNVERINTILIDFCRDIWTYISMDYFKQKVVATEVGSSAMPHKVNPIDFENAEGNFGLANAYFVFLASKLPISRLQRDLTDSTVLRNIGMPLAHTLIALKSMDKGLDKLLLNKEQIDSDLNNNWAIVAEAIQNILRREGFPNPYEMLKGLTRGNTNIGPDDIRHFVDGLNVDDRIKDEINKITPFNYTGYI